MIRLVLKIFVLLSIFFERGSVYAESINPPRLKISFKTKNEDTTHKEDIIKSCKRLGKRLKVSGGPFGIGFFSNFSCFINNDKIYGKLKDEKWFLDITEVNDTIEIELKLKTTRQSFFSIPNYQESYHYLTDSGILDLISLQILNSTPALISLPSNNIRTFRDIRMTKALKNLNLETIHPKKLTLYTLNYSSNDDLWIPTLIGHAKIKKISTEKKKKNGKKIKINKFTWHMNLDSKLTKNIRLWAHLSSGRSDKTSNKNISDLLSSAFKNIEAQSLISDNTLLTHNKRSSEDSIKRPNDLIFKYGTQFLAKDDLLGKAYLLIGEFQLRHGFLNGVKINYTAAPKINSEDDFGTAYISWNRYSIGYSLAIEFDSVINRIDITPHIGSWKLSAKLPIITENEVFGHEFNIEKSTLLGMEIGIEKIKPWYLARAWSIFEKSLDSKKLEKVQLTSLKFGLNIAFYPGVRLPIFANILRPNIQIFSQVESIDLHSEESSVQSAESIDVSSLNYITGYLGAGLGFSW
ncbi:MAG: hypothetical protein R3B45_00725 [Bdellovibrionota bacterium]